MAKFYQFCNESGRREFITDLQNDHYEMVQGLVGADVDLHNLDDLDPAERAEVLSSAGKVSRIRVMFTFTSKEGLVTNKIFQDLDKVEHFLLWDRAYGREVKGVQKKPDWSRAGLCAYSKEITLGVIQKSKGKHKGIQGFLKNPIQKYYGEESE